MHSWKSTSYLRAFSIAVTVSNTVFLDWRGIPLEVWTLEHCVVLIKRKIVLLKPGKRGEVALRISDSLQHFRKESLWNTNVTVSSGSILALTIPSIGSTRCILLTVPELSRLIVFKSRGDVEDEVTSLITCLLLLRAVLPLDLQLMLKQWLSRWYLSLNRLVIAGSEWLSRRASSLDYWWG